MNERTHFFIKIYLSHFILKRGCFLCVKGELEMGTNCYILTQSSSDHSSTYFAFWLDCSTVGHWGPKAICRWLSIQHLVPNWLQLQLELKLTDPSRLWDLVIKLSDVHLLPVGVCICHHHRIQPCPQVKVIFQYLRPDAPVLLFFRLFTQVHLLIDGSVEGQYVTISCLRH